MTMGHRSSAPSPVRIQGADGEWVEIGHTAEGSLTLDEPDTDGMKPILPTHITADEAEFLRTALRLTLEAYRRAFEEVVPAVIEAMRQVAAAAESARSRNEYVLAPPPPGRCRDRPAWQSPYGPPTRHRR